MPLSGVFEAEYARVCASLDYARPESLIHTYRCFCNRGSNYNVGDKVQGDSSI